MVGMCACVYEDVRVYEYGCECAIARICSCVLVIRPHVYLCVRAYVFAYANVYSFISDLEANEIEVR